MVQGCPVPDGDVIPFRKGPLWCKTAALAGTGVTAVAAYSRPKNSGMAAAQAGIDASAVAVLVVVAELAIGSV